LQFSVTSKFPPYRTVSSNLAHHHICHISFTVSYHHTHRRLRFELSTYGAAY